MRRLKAVLSVCSTGIFCLMMSHAVWAVTLEEANKQLFDAVWANDLDAVQRSIGVGADPGASNENGLSAVDVAVDKGFFDIAHYLLAASGRNNQGSEPSAPQVAISPGVPAPAPSISVQAAPLETQAPELEQVAKQQQATAPLSVPPIDRELVDEAPEPIVIMPIIPSVEQSADRQVAKSKNNPGQTEKLQIDAIESDEEPNIVDKIANLFSPSKLEEEKKVNVPVELAPVKAPEPVSPAKQNAAPDVVSAHPKLNARQPEVISTPAVNPPEELSTETFIDKIGDIFSPKKASPEPEQVSALDELEILDPTKIDEPADTPKPSIPDATLNDPETLSAVPSSKSEEVPERVAQAPVTEKSPSPSKIADEPNKASFISKIGDFFQPAKSQPTGAASVPIKEGDVDLPPLVNDQQKRSEPEPLEIGVAEDKNLGYLDELHTVSPPKDVDRTPQVSTQTAEAPNSSEDQPKALKAAEPSSDSGSLIDAIGDFFSTGKQNPPATQKPSTIARETSPLDELETFDETQAEQLVAPSSRTASKGAPTPDSAIAPNLQPKAAQSSDKSLAVTSKQPEPAIEPQRSTKPAEKISSGNTVNPFTRLTDLILDILPEGDADTEDEAADEMVAEKGEPTETLASIAPKDPVIEKSKPAEVEFPVEDLTTQEDPYKVVVPSNVVAKPTSIEPNTQPIETAVVPPSKVDIEPEFPLVQPPKQMALIESDLSFGDDGQIGTKMPENNLINGDCVTKKAWNSHFCIQSFKWPPGVRDAFGIPMFFQGGGQSIVHYIAGRSVQYHGLFPTASFKPITSYLVSRYGSPSERPKIWTAMLAEKKRQNQTFRWVASANDGGADIVLEIREIDDLRWSAPPDKTNGVIRLYRKGDKSVFRLLTTADLLLLQVRKGNDPPSPPTPKFN